MFSLASREVGSGTSAQSISFPQPPHHTTQAVQGLVAFGKRYLESMEEILPVSHFLKLGERKEAGMKVALRSAWAAENFDCFIGDFYMLVQIDESRILC